MIEKCSQFQNREFAITRPFTSSIPMQSTCAPELCFLKS